MNDRLTLPWVHLAAILASIPSMSRPFDVWDILVSATVYVVFLALSWTFEEIPLAPALGGLLAWTAPFAFIGARTLPPWAFIGSGLAIVSVAIAFAMPRARPAAYVLALGAALLAPAAGAAALAAMLLATPERRIIVLLLALVVAALPPWTLDHALAAGTLVGAGLLAPMISPIVVDRALRPGGQRLLLTAACILPGIALLGAIVSTTVSSRLAARDPWLVFGGATLLGLLAALALLGASLGLATTSRVRVVAVSTLVAGLVAAPLLGAAALTLMLVPLAAGCSVAAARLFPISALGPSVGLRGPRE